MVPDELPGGEPVSIVLVGTRSGVLADVARVLRAGGFAVAHSSGSRAAVAMGESPAALALLGPGLADRSARRLCGELRRKCPHQARLLVASGPDLPPGRLRLLEQGLIQGVVAWPAPAAVLLRCVGTHVRLQSSETRLRESRRNYEGLFDNNHAAMLIIDPAEGRIIDANPAAVRYYGWSRDEMRTKRMSDINTLSREEIAQAMGRARAMNQNFFQFRHRRADGSVHDVEVYSGPVRLRGQDLLYSLVFDITERKRAEAELIQARQDWEDIFQAIGHSVIILDPRFRILAANRATVKITGRPVEELVGARCYDLFHATHEPPRGCPMVRLLQTAENEVAEMEVETLGGVYLVSCTPVFDANGALSKIIHITMDISEQKRAERELAAAVAQAQEMAAKSEAASRAKSEFLAHMSHEIRTPLNGASGMLQLLQISPLNAEQGGYVGAALKALHRLNRLLLDVLDLSRIEAGKLSIEALDFELASMPEQLREMFALAAESKNLQLEFFFDPNLPHQVRGDETRLRQILFNLVGNAVKFTNKGFVRVTAALSGNPVQGRAHVLFTVEDSGVGIVSEDIDGIFEAFAQGEADGPQARQGAGLGLAIVRRLVGLMGGEISVESVPGEGTLFALALPFALVPESLAAQPSTPGQDSCSLARRRVLVAEDDPVSALYLETLLTRCGHEVVVVHDGRQAVDMLADRVFDLVFMDVQMPVMDGLEAVRVIRSLSGPAARVPVVALTAYAMVGDRERFLAAGMNDHIPKPVRMDEVRAVLERTLGDRYAQGAPDSQSGSFFSGLPSPGSQEPN